MTPKLTYRQLKERASELEKIFKSLYSTKSFGVGLGLTNTRQLMEQHGGGICVESRPGIGTEVILW